MSNGTNTKLPADVEYLVDRLIDAKMATKQASAETTRYRKMLYEMTSLADWQQAGYDPAEYAALVEEFEGK